MKKLIATILSLTTMLTFAACSEKAPIETGTGEGMTLPTIAEPIVETAAPDAVPTPEEEAEIYKYLDIVSSLNKYVESGHVSHDLLKELFPDTEDWYCGSGYLQQVFDYCYKTIQELDGVDKWNNSAWAEENGYKLNRQEVLDNFFIVEDVYLYQDVAEYDVLGNAQVYYTRDQQYNLQGLPVRTLGGTYEDDRMIWDMGTFFGTIYDVKYQYDENGKITSWKVFDEDSITERVIELYTPEYDEKGRMVYVKIQGDADMKDWYLSITYDEAGRYDQLTYHEYHEADSASVSVERTFVWTYHYDENGNVTDIVQDNTYVNHGFNTSTSTESFHFVYTYDEKGHLQHMQYTDEYIFGDTTHLYDFVCDENGRVIQGIYRKDSPNNSNFDRREVNFVYGTYYDYIPAN